MPAALQFQSSAEPSQQSRSTHRKYRPTIHGKGGVQLLLLQDLGHEEESQAQSIYYALAGYNGMTFTP
ncbi:hypothetical protein AVEN_1749-1 [Araneus ventricosus]|uniref:Uncharacterized protein n=1 Tax=Araneus ventricosus TaxID=182803 RepID=A0A4Y2NDP4_ARAVE|nr:hypothetical protein AVEN_1749-1 [Araneus ventricosus]